MFDQICRRRAAATQVSTATGKLDRVTRMQARLAEPGPLCCYAAVRLTLGISCERPICSTLVCFIPLFDGSWILRLGRGGFLGRLVAHESAGLGMKPANPLVDQLQIGI